MNPTFETSEPVERSTERAERTSVSLPRSLARRLAREAELSRRSASAVVRDALQAYFTGRDPEEPPPFVGVGGSGRADTSGRAKELVAKAIERRHRRGRGR